MEGDVVETEEEAICVPGGGLPHRAMPSLRWPREEEGDERPRLV